jgi:hypothetical protein
MDLDASSIVNVNGGFNFLELLASVERVPRWTIESIDNVLDQFHLGSTPYK